MWAAQKHPAVLRFAILGALSGALCSFEFDLAEKIYVLEVPIYHGLVFGLAIGFGLFWLGNIRWTGTIMATVMTLLAWMAAFRAMLAVTDGGQDLLYAGALVAGAVGAAGTLLSGAISCPALRQLKAWAVTVLCGAIAGLLVLYPIDKTENYWFVLFVPWQALVAGCIGYFLIREDEGS